METSPASGAEVTKSYLHQVQTVVPVNGATVSMTDDDKDGTLHLKPAGALLTLTINVPSNANSRLGQKRCISTTQTITTLTLNGGTLLNGISTINANEHISFRKVDSNTWIREI